MAKPPRLLVQFLVLTLVGGLAVGVCLALLVPGFRQIGVAHTYTAEVGALRDLASGSIVYDAAGTEIGRLAAGEGNRVPVDLADVPKLIQNAVIATEDQSFWTNPGFDVGGSARALFENLGSGSIEQGGSTITQQLVKKRLLNEEQDVNRKIREMVLALPPHREVHQTADPRAVPEHRLLRSGFVRCASRRSSGSSARPTSPTSCRPRPRCSPAVIRSPERRQPVGLPRAGAASAQPRARADGGPGVHHLRRGRVLGGAAARRSPQTSRLPTSGPRTPGSSRRSRSCSTTRGSARRARSGRPRSSRAA